MVRIAAFKVKHVGKGEVDEDDVAKDEDGGRVVVVMAGMSAAEGRRDGGF